MIREYIARLFRTRAERNEESSLEKEKEFYRGLHETAVNSGHYGSSRLRTLDTEEGHIR